MAADAGKDKEKDAGGGAVDGLTPPTMKYESKEQQTMKYTDERTQIGVPGTSVPAAPNTIQAQPNTIQASPATYTPKSRGQSIASEMGETVLAIPMQDLSGEKLLLSAARMESHGQTVPSLNGIPLLAKLGQGGMGAVYFGIHPRLRSEVAVKVLPFHLAEQDPGMIRRFFREAQIAAQVRSPHLVNVMDVNEEAGLFFLVMEYVSGCTAGQYLKQLLEQSKPGMSESDMLDLIIAATEGLHAAHTSGVVHRDIKPENIMIPYAGRDSKAYDLRRAKLMDLGLARSEESNQSLTGAQAAMGTPGYMAPEQAMDAKTADKRSDVFSMGATMYALLSGRPPFKGETIMKVLMATMHEPHAPIATLRQDISPAINDLIEKCLAKKQEHRFADAKTLLTALEDCKRIVGSGSTAGLSGARTYVYQGSNTPAPGDAAQNTQIGLGGTMAPTGTPKSKGTMLIAAGVAAVLIGGGAFLMTRGGKETQNVVVGPGPGPQPPDDTGKPGPKPANEAERKAHIELFNSMINLAQESVKKKDLTSAQLFAKNAGTSPLAGEKDMQAKLAEVNTGIQNLLKLQKLDESLNDINMAIAKNKLDDALTKLALARVNAVDEESKKKTDDLQTKIIGLQKEQLVKTQFATLMDAANKSKTQDVDKSLKTLDEIKTLVKNSPLANDPALVRLNDELNSLKADKDRNEQYNGLLAEAKTLAGAQKFEEAVDKVNKARTLQPARDEAIAMLKDLEPKLGEAQRKKQQEEAARQIEAAFNESIASAQKAFDGGNLSEADSAVKKALGLKKDSGAAADLQKRIADAITAREQKEDRARKVRLIRENLQSATDLANAGDVDSATQQVADARKILPDDVETKALFDDADKVINTKRQEIQRDQQFDKAISEAKAALEKRLFDDAATAASRAEKLKPKDPTVANLIQTIDKQKQAEVQMATARKQQVDAKLTAAESAFKASDFTAALKSLEEARTFDSTDKRITERETEYKAAQKKADEAFQSAYTSAVGKIGKGQIGDAITEIQALSQNNKGRRDLAQIVDGLQAFQKAAQSASTALGDIDGRIRSIDAKAEGRAKNERAAVITLRDRLAQLPASATQKLAANFKDAQSIASGLSLDVSTQQRDVNRALDIYSDASRPPAPPPVRPSIGENVPDDPPKRQPKSDSPKPKKNSSVGENIPE